MDLAEIVVTSGGVALIGFILWFFFGGQSDEPAPADGAVVYACPMHPWITSAEPGENCSICEMQLVRVE